MSEETENVQNAIQDTPEETSVTNINKISKRIPLWRKCLWFGLLSVVIGDLLIGTIVNFSNCSIINECLEDSNSKNYLEQCNIEYGPYDTAGVGQLMGRYVYRWGDMLLGKSWIMAIVWFRDWRKVSFSYNLIEERRKLIEIEGRIGAAMNFSRGKHLLEKAAGRGSLEATYWLGFGMLNEVADSSYPSDTDESKAISLLKRVIDKNDSFYSCLSCYALGCFFLGENTFNHLDKVCYYLQGRWDARVKNEYQGTYYLHQAAKRQDLRAAYKLAIFYNNKNDFVNRDKVIEYIVDDNDKLDKRHKAEYLYNLGMYLRDTTIDEDGTLKTGLSNYAKGDTSKAFELIMISANMGMPEAEWQVALGWGLSDLDYEEQYNESNKWLNKAAAHGLKQAQEALVEQPQNNYNLACEYKKGSKYYPYDIKKAVFLLERSCEANYVPALDLLGEIYYFGDGIEEDFNKAFALWMKAASLNDALAQRRIGFCYSKGNGCSVDLDEAFTWYMKAANNNDSIAQYQVALAFANGNGTNKDINEGMKWVEKSANNGFAPAQYELATLLLGNADGKKRYGEGGTLLKKAAEQGECKAMFLLGLLAASAEDVSEAEKWLKKAMNHKECDEKSRNEISSLLNVGGLFGISKKESLKMSAGLILMELFPNLYEE